MQLYELRQGGVLVLRPSGQLTSASSGDFENEVRARIDAGDRTLIFDLGDLEFVSSAGLRVFLVLAKTLKKAGGTISLCAMNTTVSQVFEVTGLSSILPTFPTVSEAIAVAQA